MTEKDYNSVLENESIERDGKKLAWDDSVVTARHAELASN